ncbi:MAG: A/G-specific adenine glycosylase [Myxococcales bacterium]|nr:A/G-specific adenine glycosylase [Myxococcales bacterium]
MTAPRDSPPPTPPPPARAQALLDWFAAWQRDLPWRSAQPDPYAVLVSELMLQQTRVDTVKPYFARWMSNWPTPTALAAASTDEVLAAWTGLGYYNRARNLHKAARIIAADHNGALPRDRAALGALPGVGPYTLGAVRSIAFGQPEPLVDGNVGRVLSRWTASRLPATSTAGKKALWSLAQELMETPPARSAPGAWNQALMELGALVCTPKKPACSSCPVAEWCAAHAAGIADQLPVRKPKKPPKPVIAAYLLLMRDDGKLWCGQRAAKGRWAGLWEPPGVEGPDSASVLQATFDLGGEHEVLPTIVHVLTHRRYEVTPVLVRSDNAAPPLAPLGYVAERWISPAAAVASTSGFSRLGARLVAAAAAAGQDL